MVRLRGVPAQPGSWTVCGLLDQAEVCKLGRNRDLADALAFPRANLHEPVIFSWTMGGGSMSRMFEGLMRYSRAPMGCWRMMR